MKLKVNASVAAAVAVAAITVTATPATAESGSFPYERFQAQCVKFGGTYFGSRFGVGCIGASGFTLKEVQAAQKLCSKSDDYYLDYAVAEPILGYSCLVSGALRADATASPR